MASTSTTTEPQPPPTPTAQPEAVLAEEVKVEKEEDITQSKLFVEEVASLINHEDIQAILAVQAEMYVTITFIFSRN